MMPIIAINKRATYDYEILEDYEAGLMLTGPEVKSARNGHINLKGSFAAFKDNELFLLNTHISPYTFAKPDQSYDPSRSRKLLLKKKEIARLKGKLNVKGLTLLPLRVYTTKTRLKVVLGLGRGKKQFEKREIMKKRDVERQIREELKRK
ncbi:SsrA-binding protein SmpB [Candidatus Uhrbacteria bacterium]|nr:SsrA-binding protein SmpB [Candidatus Uhrbacteria bacterium]